MLSDNVIRLFRKSGAWIKNAADRSAIFT